MRSSAVRLVLVVSLAVTPSHAAEQGGEQPPCPDGRPLAGDLGITALRCSGGACAIHVREEDGHRHEFSTEPSVVDIRPDGPSVPLVREGDVLVAIDRTLLTTPAGGRKLARLEPGVPVELWLRRRGRDVRVTLTPTAGCGVRSLTVSGAR